MSVPVSEMYKVLHPIRALHLVLGDTLAWRILLSCVSCCGGRDQFVQQEVICQYGDLQGTNQDTVLKSEVTEPLRTCIALLPGVI